MPRVGYYARTPEQRAAQGERARKYPKETDSRSRLYRVWRAMLCRCNNMIHEAYGRYGGRGITVCDEWKTYAPFRAWALASGYADNLEIERRDNDRGYSADNCCWETRSGQSRNRRNSLPPIPAFGDSKTPIEWSEDPRCRVSYRLLHKRLAAGESPESALTRPSASRTEALKIGQARRSSKEKTPSLP